MNAASNIYRWAAKRTRCPQCGSPRGFARVIEFGSPVEGKGQCHTRCGFLWPDGDFTDYVAPPPEPAKPLRFIDEAIARASMNPNAYHKQTFARQLIDFFGRNAVLPVFQRYGVGTNKRGEAIFWYRDADGRYRKPKTIEYVPDGDRVVVRDPKADPPMHFNGFNNALGFRLCFFGEHLLRGAPSATVNFVESEKAALVAAIHYKDSPDLWLATGGSTMFREEILTPILPYLRGRNLAFYPDSDKAGYEAVGKAEKVLAKHGLSVTCIDVYNGEANRKDLADWIIEAKKAGRA